LEAVTYAVDLRDREIFGCVDSKDAGYQRCESAKVAAGRFLRAQRGTVSGLGGKLGTVYGLSVYLFAQLGCVVGHERVLGEMDLVCSQDRRGF
jgi:ribosomal protein L27